MSTNTLALEALKLNMAFHRECSTEYTNAYAATWQAIAALEAESVQPAHQQAVQEPVWMPIETTPKDGTAYDIWADGQRYTNMITCSYGGHHPAGGGTFIYRSHRVLRATHWMPLPTAPQQEKTK